MTNEKELVELKIALQHFKEFNGVFANEYDVDPDCYLSIDEVQMTCRDTVCAWIIQNRGSNEQ